MKNQKQNLSIENDGSDFTDEQRMQINAENPLAININRKVVLNGTVLSGSRSCGVSWNPCFPEGNDIEAKNIIRHYGLDPAYGWAIWRAAFPWTKKRELQITTLSITLMQRPVAISGSHFHVSTPGERIEFTHPTTDAKHTLIVQGYEQHEISREHFDRQNQEFPTYCTVMSYMLSSDLPDGAFTVTDCVRPDQPRQKRTNPNEPQHSSAIVLVSLSVRIVRLPSFSAVANKASSIQHAPHCTLNRWTMWNGAWCFMKKAAKILRRR